MSNYSEMTLKERFKEAYKILGISSQELAELMGKANITIRAKLCGQIPVTKTDVGKLEAELDFRYEEITEFIANVRKEGMFIKEPKK